MTIYGNKSSDNRYSIPTVIVLSIESEDALAKSNTEQIIDDDEEYGWD